MEANNILETTAVEAVNLKITNMPDETRQTENIAIGNMTTGNMKTENITIENITLENLNTGYMNATNPEIGVVENTDVVFRTQLEIIYRVMMQRITLQMSAAELSFLIGRPADYVSDVEMLKIEPYTSEDLKCIAIALNNEEIGFLSAVSANDRKISVIMTRECLDGICIHRCEINVRDNTFQNYYTLHEFMGGTIDPVAEADAHYLNLIADTIKVLLNAGYFYEYRLPVKIYRSINRFLKLKLNPALVKEALDNFCKVSGILNRVEDEQNRIRYVEL